MKKIAILPYLFILVVTTLIFFYIAHSQEFNFNFPLRYDGDTIEVFAYTKSVLQNDFHSSLYAPFSYDDVHNPMKVVCRSIYGLLLKTIGQFTNDDLAKTVSIYYFMTFLLSSLSALYVMSRCGVFYPVGISLGLLYSFCLFIFIEIFRI